jgi:hypothetical protein
LDDDEGPVDHIDHEEDAETLLGLLARAWNKGVSSDGEIFEDWKK